MLFKKRAKAWWEEFTLRNTEAYGRVLIGNVPVLK